MSDLKTNLQEILQDKNTNLLPENLKAGITCLGIEGTLEGETPVVKTVTCYETDATNSDKANSTTVSGYRDLIFVGGSNNCDYRAYLKHDLTELQTIPDIEIVSAKLHFTIAVGNDYYRDGSGYVFKCTSDWSSDTLNWNNQPELKSYIDDIQTPSYSPDVDVPYTYSLDITSIVKSWIDNKYPNYGICFKGTEGGGYRLDHRIASAKYDNGQYASYIEVQYKVTVSDITLQEKSVDIIDNGATEVVPDSDYYGLSKVNINTNVPTGIDTSDANATVNDIVSGKTAYVNGEKVTGILPLFPNSRTFTVDGGITNDTENNRIQIHTINTTKQILDSNLNMEFNGEYSDVANAVGLTPEKLVKGNTILGVEGTVDPEGVQITDYFNTIPEDGQNLIKAYPDTIDCSNLTSLNFSTDFGGLYISNLINTSNVTSINSISSSNTLGFIQTELDVSSVQSFMNVFNYYNMITSTPKLKNLFKNGVSSVEFSNTYAYCSNLETIPAFEIACELSELNEKQATVDNMLVGCDKLSEQSITNILNFLKILNDNGVIFNVHTLSEVGLSYSQLTSLTETQLEIINSMSGWTTGLELYTTEIEIGELYGSINGRMIPTNITLQNYLNIVETKTTVTKWIVWVYVDYMHLETLEFTSSSDLITSLNSLKFKTSNETISVNLQINVEDETGGLWGVTNGYENIIQANNKTAINLLLTYLPVNININTKTKNFDNYHMRLWQLDSADSTYEVFDDFMYTGGWYLSIDVNTILTTSIQDIQPYKFKMDILSPEGTTTDISCMSNSFTEENLTMTFDIEEVVLEDVSTENTIITDMTLYPQSDTQFVLYFNVSGEVGIENIYLYNNDIQLEWSLNFGNNFSDGTYVISGALLTDATNVSDITAYSYGPKKENDVSL